MERCKKKGFVFTVDTIFAIIIALSLATALVSTQQTEKGKEKMFETAAQKARDTAMVDFYVSRDTANPSTTGKEYYYGANTIRYNIPTEIQGERKPADVMLMMDKSGSMSTYDMLAKKSTGVFNEGKCKSEPMWVSGRFNNALQFNGASNYVYCGNDPKFDITTGKVTISAWVKITDPNKNQWQIIASKKYRFDYVVEGYGLRYHPLLNRLEMHGASDNDVVQALNVDLDNKWHHIVGIIDGTTGALYVDNINKTTDSTTLAIAPSNKPFRIGYMDEVKVGSYFDGTIDDVRLFNTALGAADVGKLYNNDDSVTNGLIGRWKFDETSGLIASDSSGNNTSCSLKQWASATQEPKWVPGKLNNALSFDGRDSYVDFGNNASLKITGNLTISFWTYPTDVARGNQNLIDKAYSGEYSLLMASDGRLIFYQGHYGCSCGGFLKYEWANVFQNGTWVHVTIMRDVGGKSIKLYKNGALQTPSYTTSWDNPSTSSLPVLMGKGWATSSSSGAFFSGKIDEVRIYNRALTENDAKELAGIPAGGDITTNLVSYWRLDESSGDIAADSANGNNGTLYNWSAAAEGACYAEAGQGEQVTTNCPASKATQYYGFTNAKTISYLLPEEIRKKVLKSDSLTFGAVTTPYNGYCIYPKYTAAELWVKRPDGIVESNYPWARDTEDVVRTDDTELPSGTYDVNVWSDTLVNYYVYLKQNINYYDDNLAVDVQVPAGTHDGAYAPPETDCTNLQGWQYIRTYDFSGYNQIYYERDYFNYGPYTSIGGDCGTPRFQARYKSEGSEWTIGKVGGALSFGGNDRKNYVEIPAGPELNVQNFTFSAWFKTRRPSATDYWTTNAAIFTRGNNNGKNELFIGNGYTRGDQIDIALHRNDDGTSHTFSGKNLWDGQWHHIAVTYNSSSLKVFVDGVQYGDTFSTTAVLDFGSSNAWIGADSDTLNGSLGNYWFGAIDEVRLYNTALPLDDPLSTNDILGIYSTELAGNPSTVAPGNLVGYWALDETKISPGWPYAAADSSGKLNHGKANLDLNFNISNCGSGNNSGCLINTMGNGLTGPYRAAGKYEVWAWSDVATTANARTYDPQQFWGIIFGDFPKPDTLSSGTCFGEACTRVVSVPSTNDSTNCPLATGTMMPTLPGADNNKLVSTFPVSTHLRGLKANVTFDYLAGASAVCNGAATGFQNPIDGSNDPNWYYLFPAKGATITHAFYVNSPTNIPGYEYWNWTKTPPITTGDYNIIGWAEKSVNYDVNWYLQRVDAAKNAAKSFLDNPGWGASDRFGLASYSDSATTDTTPPLATNKEVVKTALNNLSPSGQTALGAGIREATIQLTESSSKYIIILTDGKANIPTSEAAAIADATSAANAARQNGITIYVIGFAALSEIQSNVIGITPARTYESVLQEIAKDEATSYCTDNILCGKYFYAPDEATLTKLYKQLAGWIGNPISRRQGDITKRKKVGS